MSKSEFTGREVVILGTGGIKNRNKDKKWRKPDPDRPMDKIKVYRTDGEPRMMNFTGCIGDICFGSGIKLGRKVDNSSRYDQPSSRLEGVVVRAGGYKSPGKAHNFKRKAKARIKHVKNEGMRAERMRAEREKDRLFKVRAKWNRLFDKLIISLTNLQAPEFTNSDEGKMELVEKELSLHPQMFEEIKKKANKRKKNLHF